MMIKDAELKDNIKRNLSKLYPILLLIIIANIIIKIYLGKDMEFFIVDIIVLVVLGIYFISDSLINTTLFTPTVSNETIVQRERIKRNLFLLTAVMFTIGAIIYLIIYKDEELLLSTSYVLIWLIPSVYVALKTTREKMVATRKVTDMDIELWELRVKTLIFVICGLGIGIYTGREQLFPITISLVIGIVVAGTLAYFAFYIVARHVLLSGKRRVSIIEKRKEYERKYGSKNAQKKKDKAKAKEAKKQSKNSKE